MSEEKRTKSRRRRKPRSNRSRMAGSALYALLVIAVSAVLATVGWTWANDLLALNKDYTSIIMTIPPESITEDLVIPEEGEPYTVLRANIDEITEQLEQEGLINYKFLFRLYAWFSNADQKIVAGTYELDTDMDYRALVVNMGRSSATRQTIDVTIPEGYSVDQIFRLLDEKDICSEEELREMAANWPYKWSFLQDLPLGDYRRLEGYLFPDTYTFYLGE